MTAKRNETSQLIEPSYSTTVEVTEEQKILEWKNSSPVLRTQQFIKSSKNTPTDFFDRVFLKYAEDWIGVLLPYEDSFCGEHALSNWETHCKNFLGDILDKESSSNLEAIINDGATQGYFTFIDSNGDVQLLNFSWILWLLGLSEEPSNAQREEDKLKIVLINQGKLVFVQLKARRTIQLISLEVNAPIDYNHTVNNIDNKGNIGSVGASGHSTTTQTVETKKDFSLMESLKSLKIIIPAFVILVLLALYFFGKLTLADIKQFIPKF